MLVVMSQRRILIVDDQADIRRLVRWALQDGGYALFEAANGELALRIAQVSRPDLVVLDQQMPGGLAGGGQPDYFEYAVSPWLAMSRPSRSSSSVTRKPMVCFINETATTETTALQPMVIITPLAWIQTWLAIE